MNEEFFSELSLSAQEQSVIQKDILSGKYGQPGDIFFTTRALAEKCHVSLVTAHNILKGLCASGYIELRGKRYHLSHSGLMQERQNVANTIGFLLPQLNNEFYSSLSEAVVDTARRNGLHVLLMATSYNDREEKCALQAMLNYRVAGLISCVQTGDGNEQIYRNYPIPCVMLAHSIDKCRISSVQVNSFSISQKVARNLIEEGYRRFMYIGTDKISPENDIRSTAFQMEIKQQGFSLSGEDIIRFSNDADADEELLSRCLRRLDTPVGIFCYHDLLAATVYRVCDKLGKAIPDEVGVIGFDDLSIAKSLYPPLTTVQYRLATMADMAINLLLAKMKSSSAPYDNYYIEPNLVVRKSAALSKVAGASASP